MRRVLCLLPCLLLFSIVGSAFAQKTATVTYVPPDYDVLAPPAAGSSYVDPVFRSTIKRMSNSLIEPNVANGVGHPSVYCR